MHGGVRYLGQGNIALVQEALHERTLLLKNAPYLAQPLPFVLPAYNWWELPFYGTGLKMYKDALKLNPTSAIAMVEYANGLVMLEGDKKMKEAEKLYVDAAACTPLDAMERLDVEMAKAELED